MIKKTTKLLIVFFSFLIIVFVSFYLIGKNYYNIPILMYHNIDLTDEENSLYVSPDRFIKQLNFIKARGYKVLNLDEFIDYIKGENKIKSRKLVLITFDDGFRDNYTNAYKELKSYGFSAVFFMPSGKIGHEDRLTKKQILQMHKDGMDFGSHTLSEVYIPDLDNSEDIIRQIYSSKRVLERLLSSEVKALAYPIGGYTEKTLEFVPITGYKVAFTTNRGFNKSCKNNNIYQIRRIKVTDKDNNFKLWIKLTGFYNLFRSIKDPY